MASGYVPVKKFRRASRSGTQRRSSSGLISTRRGTVADETSSVVSRQAPLGALAGRDYLVGDFTAADCQMSFVGEVGRAFGRLGPHPNIAAWVDRLHARPAFKTALEKGGAYNLA